MAAVWWMLSENFNFSYLVDGRVVLLVGVRLSDCVGGGGVYYVMKVRWGA